MEWIEWNLSGELLFRTPIPDKLQGGAAFTASGRLFSLLPAQQDNQAGFRLAVLNTTTTKWSAGAANIPEPGSGLLLGAEGDDLVYKIRGSELIRLVWAQGRQLAGCPHRPAAIVDLTMWFN